MPNTKIQIKEEKSSNENLDLLNRAEFIESVINFVNYYSNQKKSISFSINGEWGSGKSWVINNLINELYEIQSEETFFDKYYVFKYNAWDFDYYEEPLIALIIAIKEQIESKNAVFIKSQKGLEKWEATKKVIKKGAYEGLHKLFKKAEKIKIIPFTPTTTTISTTIKTIGFFGNKAMNLNKKINDELQKKEKEIREYDNYFDLKELIKTTQEAFAKLTKDRTVVIFIDELDRCLPEYAIKVLERIHHLCENIENIQFIYAIDDKQLANTVKQIFGDEVSVRSYLSKFMIFGLRLPDASFNELIEKKYEDFNSVFVFQYSKECSLYEIISKSLGDIPIRNKIQIIEKVTIINKLILHNIRDYDYSILLFELFIAYCDYYEINLKDCSTNDLKLQTRNSDQTYKEQKNLYYCNKILHYFMEQVFFPSFGAQSTFVVDEDKKIYDYIPLYLSLFCTFYSGPRIICNGILENKEQSIQNVLNDFWNYYKTMEL